jgi:hypothetical protein
MPPPNPVLTAILTHGEPGFRRAGRALRQSSGGPDVLQCSFVTDDETDYPLGSAPEGYPGMRIIEREAQQDGSVWIIPITAEGLPDGVTSKMIDHGEDLPQEGWDTIARRFYTSTPNASQFLKGAQITDTAITGVSATASTDVWSKTAHGLTSGRLVQVDYSTGFGGVTEAKNYLLARIDADSFVLADPLAAKRATGVASTDVITVTAHGWSDGQKVILPQLTGGAGLSTFTVYHVRDAATNTLKLAATAGGAAIDFTTNITSGLLGSLTKIVPVLDVSSDGTGATITPIKAGYDRMWVTARQKRQARGCIEAEALSLTGYYELDLTLAGLNQVEGEVKLTTRRQQGAGQAVRVEGFAETLWESEVYSGDAMTLDASTKNTDLEGNVEFDIPQVGVQYTMILTETPPMWMLGSGDSWTPEDAPTVSYVGLYGTNDTVHFPQGWNLSNLQTEQIPGQQLWLCTFSFRNQRPTTPG